MQDRRASPAPTTLAQAQAQQQAVDMQNLAALQQFAQNGASAPARPGAGPCALTCLCVCGWCGLELVVK